MLKIILDNNSKHSQRVPFDEKLMKQENAPASFFINFCLLGDTPKTPKNKTEGGRLCKTEVEKIS